MGFWDGYQEDPNATVAVAGLTQPSLPVAQSAQPASSGGGGITGFLYRHLIAPTAKAVGGGLEDAFVKAPQSIYNLGKIGVGEATGNKGMVNQAVNAQRGVLNNSSFNKTFLAPESPALAAGNYGKAAEQGTGALVSGVLNTVGPAGGAETLAGRTGLKALALGGAKVGAKYGAAGGAAGAMENGGTGQQVFGAALEGAGLGAGLGSAGGTIGAGLGKLIGRTSSGTTTDNGGLFPKASVKAGGRSAQSERAQQAIDFAGATPTEIKNTLSHDKGGNPVGLTQVSGFMRGLGLPATAQNMEHTNTFLSSALGGNLKDITDGVPATITNPTATAATAIRANRGLLGSINRNGSGVASDTLNHVAEATKGLTDGSSVSDVLGVISRLEGDRANLGHAIGMGNTTAQAQDAVYKSVIDSLHGSLDSAGVNKAVGNFRVSPELEQAIHTDAAQNGVTPQMAQHVIDTLNNARSYGEVRSAMQPGVVAGKLARVAKETFSNTVPQAGKNTNIGVPSWELAMSLHNPTYMAAAAARLADKSNVVDSALSKINPGAFEAGKNAGLIPDDITARKLAMPGGGPATSTDTTQINPGVTTSTPGGPAGLVSRTGGNIGRLLASPTGIGAGIAQGANQVGQNLTTPATTNPADPGGIDTSNLGQILDQGTDTGSPSDTSTMPGGTLSDLEQEIQADPKNAAAYEAIYNDAQKEAAAAAPPKLNATQAKNLTNIQNATAALSNYVEGLNSLNSATRGAGVGSLNILLGRLGVGGSNAKTAAAIDSQREELAIQLAQAMNNGTKPQGAQIQQIKLMLPSINEPKGVAQQKIERLSRNLSDYLRIATNASVSSRTSGNTTDLLTELSQAQ